MGGQRWSVTDNDNLIPTRQRLEQDVRAGLAMDPAWIPARWFYDEKGSLLFEDITALPEYYPTRREEQILRDRAPEIAELTSATTMVELGAGTSAKTRLLLDAFTAGGRSMRFVPLDVSSEILADAARQIAAAYPSLHVDAIVADFDDPFGELPGTPGERLIVFLGGTVGNFAPPARAAFFRRIADALAPGDHFLLGADLVKDPARLVAAYDDSQGVTAAFDLNLIEVLSRELRAEGLSSSDFEHVARWNAEQSRIEMWLRATRPVEARFPGLDLDWSLPAGGEILTEISVKFELPQLQAELATAGLTTAFAWTDEAGDFSLTLARRG